MPQTLYPSDVRDASALHQERANQALESIEGGLETATYLDVANALLRHTKRDVPENNRDLFRAAFSSAQGFSAIAGLTNSAILQGYRSAPDSTVGWVRQVDMPNYLNAELAAVTIAPRMESVPRGETAPSVGFGVSSTGEHLMRFGCAFVIDEQDAEDNRRLQVHRVALAEIGASAKRLVTDMVYSVLLENPDLGDGTAWLHTDRANLGTAAFDATALDAGIGAIGNQTIPDDLGDAAHPNLAARHLVVPPTLLGAARRAVRAMSLGDGQDIKVHSESRLSSTGFVDPRLDAVRTGNDTNWLLACSTDQAASLVLMLLNGKAEPTVRTYEVTQGQWGVGVDVSLSLAVAAVDGKPVYFSDGTA